MYSSTIKPSITYAKHRALEGEFKDPVIKQTYKKYWLTDLRKYFFSFAFLPTQNFRGFQIARRAQAFEMFV